MKGILEGCILLLIAKEEVYGYQISMKLKQFGFSDISEGSIYPILLRMQKEKWILGEFKPSAVGPQRKYYYITAAGKQKILHFKHEWQTIKQAVDLML
nr:PadR family transcriptional regulator [Polycladospora coralii]